MALTGEIAALATASCWVVTAMSFETAGRRIGSLAVNILRLMIAFVLLAAVGLATRGHMVPTDFGAHEWAWLGLSGLVGFTFGDLTLFRALVLIGSRLSTLLMALVPPMAALIGLAALGETLSVFDMTGMALTLAGVAIAVLERPDETAKRSRRDTVVGVALGVCGAVGQAVGLILSKYGMGDRDPFASTQIRVIAGIAGFSLLYLIIGWWPKVIAGVRDVAAMKALGVGSFFGPFLGVSLSLVAVQHTQTGVAATIMAMTPILILVPTVALGRERVTWRAFAGAFLAIAGVAILLLF
ncbi:MAG: DMT family transporter [Deltaproteobacteria bacterium]|nr:DMT family transporter [Deltaproteobacteria bacterium]